MKKLICILQLQLGSNFMARDEATGKTWGIIIEEKTLEAQIQPQILILFTWR